MTNNEILKKQIIYRSTHRGSKEMDLLLGNFVKKYINLFDNNDLINLDKILVIEDEILYQWYFENKNISTIHINRVSRLLKEYKL